MPEDSERLLVELTKMLVDDQDSVRVTGTISEDSAHFEISVAPSDMGKLLGRRGVYANSIRRLFGAYYGKTGRGFTLYIVDPRRRDRDI